MYCLRQGILRTPSFKPFCPYRIPQQRQNIIIAKKFPTPSVQSFCTTRTRTHTRPSQLPHSSMDPKARHVTLDGGFNTRDLGPLPVAAGQLIKPNLIYRSDDLSTLTPLGVEAALGLGVKTIVDFRSEMEVNGSKSLLPHPNHNIVHHVPISFGNLWGKLTKQGQSGCEETEADCEEFMLGINNHLVRDAVPEITRFFAIISDPNSAPILFHCTAGKDRTGFAAALFLEGLGVDREVVFEDYLYSAHCLVGNQRYEKLLTVKPHFAPIVTVKREYLATALKIIDDEHGGVESYLRNVIGVDLDNLKQIYTETPSS